MNKRMFAVSMLAALLVLLPALSLAQSSGSPHVDAAIADLLQRLGVPLNINDFSNWTYVQNRYPDSSLGCPLAPNAPYTQGSYLAYQVTLIYQGTTIDYRVSDDLTTVFPCDAALLGGTLPAGAATFTPVIQPTALVTAAPTLAPTTGCPADFSGYLPPRLGVGGQGQVPPGNTPNRLRQSPSTSAEQIGVLNAGEVFTVVGGPVCADGFVWWQVTSQGQTGWTAEGALPNDYFVDPVGTQPPLILPTTAPVVPLPAGQIPSFAGVQNSNLALFLYSPDGGLAQTAALPVLASPTAAISDIAWSPDGLQLAYTVMDTANGATTTTLFLINASGGTPQALATDLALLMPVSFTADGTQVIYAQVDAQTPFADPDPSDPNAPAGQNMIVYSQTLAVGGEQTEIGRFVFGIGCGGGSPYPADYQFQQESSYNGNPLTLELTDFGILHSTNCTGSGLALLDADSGEDIELGETLSHADVAADGVRVVAIQDNPQRQYAYEGGAVVTFDLPSGEVTPVEANSLANQVAWAADDSGAIFYANMTQTDDFIPGSDAETFTQMGFTDGIPVHNVTVSRIDADGTETRLYEANAYGVGRLIPAADGELFFSTIPNGADWVAAVNANVINPQATFAAIANQFFPVSFLSLPPDASLETPATLLDINLSQMTLNEVAFGGAAG
jgi:hypothetical protein